MADKISEDGTLTVKDPNGNVVSVNQILPEMTGQFKAKIKTGIRYGNKMESIQ